MWWVIHMCRGFDPLFSLWQDRARSFWGIFLIHQQQSYLLGYKNYQFLQKSIFLAPNSIFSSIFWGPIFSGQWHTPISFQAEYPPRGKIAHALVLPRLFHVPCWRAYTKQPFNSSRKLDHSNRQRARLCDSLTRKFRYHDVERVTPVVKFH